MKTDVLQASNTNEDKNLTEPNINTFHKNTSLIE